ncbi:PTS sugar transporter subunit IIA [Scandinavium manionii]|uniref:PTS sugar transporter subunit IIA n=1 Tax=Scandinavium manionii TaxID=2926520 RepID=UPI0013573BCD|nr:PTS sugar transporter subunit IIA [Scandinavium manionii]MCS2150810.1 PTS sugar transporter subunit IIA [Scandinavium manionii]
MAIKELLIEAQAIQVGVREKDWQKVIEMAARPLVENGYILPSYHQAVIANTLEHGAYYVFEEGIAMPHARPECGVLKNSFSLLLLDEPIGFADSDKADIVIMFAAKDSNAHIEEGIRAIVNWLGDDDVMAKLRKAKAKEEVIAIL